MNPRISLISTVYNRAHYLGNAIESVLAQTYSDFELLIWDDGSTDGSVEIAQHYARLDSRVRVFAALHQGRAISLQAVHAEARGEYLGWIDSDDSLSPTALEETAAVLGADLQVGLVYTDYQVIDAKGKFKQNGARCGIPYSKERLLLSNSHCGEIS
jgi:glycosyltransferase involved in cell wall biosynthesis